MKFIRFRRVKKQIINGIPYYDFRENKSISKNNIKICRWEFARNEAELYEKLGTDMAEIIMPAKSWYIRLLYYYSNLFTKIYRKIK